MYKVYKYQQGMTDQWLWKTRRNEAGEWGKKTYSGKRGARHLHDELAIYKK